MLFLLHRKIHQATSLGCWGLCRYRQVKLQATTSRKEKKLKEVPLAVPLASGDAGSLPWWTWWVKRSFIMHLLLLVYLQTCTLHIIFILLLSLGTELWRVKDFWSWWYREKYVTVQARIAGWYRRLQVLWVIIIPIIASSNWVWNRISSTHHQTFMICPQPHRWQYVWHFFFLLLWLLLLLEAAKLLQAMKYFQEANVLDRERPDILAWLTICAVELGLVQVAKQGIRVVVLWVQRDEAFSRLQVVGSYKDLLFIHFVWKRVAQFPISINLN